MNGEIHLVIIWSRAAVLRSALEQEIALNLKIKRAFTVSWSSRFFTDNLRRFYGINLPAGIDKQAHCGDGPFSAYIVHDLAPNYALRATSKAEQIVNINIFDLKTKLREMTGGGHKIHATNNPQEAAHDILLLLNRTPTDFAGVDDWNGDHIHFPVDLLGSAGWTDLEQIFRTLNQTSEYVVLRNFTHLPTGSYLDGHGDIDLLTTDSASLAFILNATPMFRDAHRVHYSVSVSGKNILFDFRSVTDFYYDYHWSCDILLQRVKCRDLFYIPDQNHHFYSLLYHAIIHKPAVGTDYIEKLTELNPALPVSHQSRIDLLASFLRSQKYYITRPVDRSVYFHNDNAHALNVPIISMGVAFEAPSDSPQSDHQARLVELQADKIRRMQLSFSWRSTAWLRALRRAKDKLFQYRDV